VRIACANGAQAAGRVRGLVADLRQDADRVIVQGPFDLVLAADLLYDDELAAALVDVIPALTAPGGRALVAFPWPGQAKRLGCGLTGAGMAVEWRELAIPDRPGARAVGLLEATAPLASNRTSRWDTLERP
jgi:hypothetical protein